MISQSSQLSLSLQLEENGGELEKIKKNFVFKI